MRQKHLDLVQLALMVGNHPIGKGDIATCHHHFRPVALHMPGHGGRVHAVQSVLPIAPDPIGAKVWWVSAA